MSPSDLPAVGRPAAGADLDPDAGNARIELRPAAWLAAAVLWTLFVWVNRIRNALADDDMGGASLAGVIALSLSFVIPAVVVAVLAASTRTPGRRDAVTKLVTAMLAWTAAVWAVRAVDITLLDDGGLVLMGGHDAPFVVVHVMLGVVSVALWWGAHSSLRS